jgi:hypothetical protein
MAEEANGASPTAKRTAKHAKCQGLVIQVGGLVTKNALANGSQQGRVGGITERPVEWHGEDLGSYQNGHADFESGKFPQPSKSAIDPMAAEPGNPLTI